MAMKHLRRFVFACALSAGFAIVSPALAAAPGWGGFAGYGGTTQAPVPSVGAWVSDSVPTPGGTTIPGAVVTGMILESPLRYTALVWPLQGVYTTEPGDVIRAVNGVPVDGAVRFQAAMNDAIAGALQPVSVDLTIFDARHGITVTVRTLAYP